MRLGTRPISLVLLLVIFFAFLFLYGLNSGDLRRTEGLRESSGAEMLRSGNVVVPQLYGEPILTKPPGMYAAIAVVSLPFGEVSPWSARLPSALAAGVSVWMFYLMFARRLGQEAGIAAAVILPMSFMWLERAPSAEIDMLQLAWVMGSLFFFLKALEAAEDGSQKGSAVWIWWLLALLCVAGGVLTKWTAPAFFYLTIIPLLWQRRRLSLLWSLPHLVAVLCGMAICAGWALAVIGSVGWQPFYETVSREMLVRLSPSHHPRPYPWRELIEFPMLVIASNLPWALLALLTFGPRFASLWDERQRLLLQMLQCWTWVNLLFWIVVPGHRPRHCLPMQPGLAGLATFAVVAWTTGRLRWPLRKLELKYLLAATMLFWIGVKTAYIHAVLPAHDHGFSPRLIGEELAALIPADQTLYLCRLKDEGALYYYRRPAHRLGEWTELRDIVHPVYCLLTEPEWQGWPLRSPAEVVARLHDEQGDSMILVHYHTVETAD